MAALNRRRALLSSLPVSNMAIVTSQSATVCFIGPDGSPTPAAERLLASPYTGSAAARVSLRSGNIQTQQKLYPIIYRLYVVFNPSFVESSI